VSMMFFRFDARELLRYPWGRTTNIGVAEKHYGPDCPGCGRRESRYYGKLSVKIEGGGVWPDILSNRDGYPTSFMLSERVIESLSKAGVTSFEAQPVRIVKVASRKLRQNDAPRYYYLNIVGRIDIDWEASGLADVPRCPVCGCRNGSNPAGVRAFVPLADSWDGSDIFELRNYPSGMVFCSEKVLFLARQHRWTNFYFEPMDVLQRYTWGWPGIDYLGNRWPPKWYPDPPHVGKSTAEWVEEFCSGDYWRQKKASAALTELIDEAMPLLLRLVKEGPPKVADLAAHQILGWSREQKDSIPAEVAQACAAVIVQHLDDLDPYNRYLAARLLSSYHETGVIQLAEDVLARVDSIVRGVRKM